MRVTKRWMALGITLAILDHFFTAWVYVEYLSKSPESFLDLAMTIDSAAVSLATVVACVGASFLGAKLGRLFMSRRQPSLKGISNFADFFGLGLRKRIKAVAGDYEVEIKRLHKEKRYKTAKWNKALAWSYAIWYVLRGPVDWFAETLIKSWKGL